MINCKNRNYSLILQIFLHKNVRCSKIYQGIVQKVLGKRKGNGLCRIDDESLLPTNQSFVTD